MGNTVGVAIKNYLPKELQLAIYNQRVRRFQNVLIASATNGEAYQINALDLKNEKELKDYLAKLDERVPLWRNVIHTISNYTYQSNHSAAPKITLDICPENVAILRACKEISTKHMLNDPNFKENLGALWELAEMYDLLVAYVKSSGDRNLDNVIKLGDLMYDRKADNYKDLKINKTKSASIECN